MIGDIMLLIPGILMTNSIRDILIGDTISGVMRLVESLLWAEHLPVDLCALSGLLEVCYDITIFAAFIELPASASYFICNLSTFSCRIRWCTELGYLCHRNYLGI